MEHARTRFVLQGGARALASAFLRVLFRHPLRLVKALATYMEAQQTGRSPPPRSFDLSAGSLRRLSAGLKSKRSEHLHAHFGTNPAEVAMLVHELGGPRWSFTAHGPEEFDKAEFIA